jgi:hypothetical protein
VLQSLSLWRALLDRMYELWLSAEADMLDPRYPYALRDTGQGLNRVQPCPRVGRAMAHVIDGVQRRVGGWVGSAVVHLGDQAVPNALMFIEKYATVSRILAPLVRVIDAVPAIGARSPALAALVESYGGAEPLRTVILADFFRHAFDGSGADDYINAGSCIDGRLTSAWEWTSLIEKKRYWPIFQLSGFTSFDGEY